MKLVTKIFFIYLLTHLSGFSIAQDNETEAIIKTQIASSKIYLDGELLNNDKLNFTFNNFANYSRLHVNNNLLLATKGIRYLNIEDNKKFIFSNTISENIFDKNKFYGDKVYGNIQFDFTNENDEEFFYDKPLFKILLGSFVALGAATAYFKIKADRKFADYKKANNQSLLDDTNKYDAISGVTFALMEINFGVLVYYFLRD